MIAVDWGTSSFRAYRLGADGTVRERRSAAAGLLACNGAYEAVLRQQLDGWDDAVIAMAGMIGSRSGWHEVPYVACPAGADAIAAGMHEIEAAAFAGRGLLIAPGLSHQPPDAPAEVMRGEETQLLGLLDELDGAGLHTLCLPGTHSKWVAVEGGRIVSFRTAMTGEMYALLRRHSLLAALMPPVDAGDVDDIPAFERGVAASATAGGLLHHLFGVRTSGLFATLTSVQAPSYLSGLLIGHELHGILPAPRPLVHLIGGAALLRRYERALALLGATTRTHGEELSARGLHRLARARGLTA